MSTRDRFYFHNYVDWTPLRIFPIYIVILSQSQIRTTRLLLPPSHMNTNIECLRLQHFTWEVAGTSVGENPRWVRFHRIFRYTCIQSNIMCSCCVWSHGNGLVGFYSLQNFLNYVFFSPSDNLSAQVLKVWSPYMLNSICYCDKRFSA
jgi:hypothetical protein